MNLYEGSVSGPAEQLVVTLGSQKLTLPPETGQSKPALVGGDGRRVIVGVRPEHLSLRRRRRRAARLTADVELVEALGNELLVHFVTDAKAAHPDRAPRLGRRSGLCGRRGRQARRPQTGFRASIRART